MFIGQIAALGAVFCWVTSSMSFENAGKMIGSLPLNFIRLVIALLLNIITTGVVLNIWFPVNYPMEVWFWLSLSGVVGFFLGDLFLFKAFVDIGARIAMLIYSLAAPMTAILEYIVFRERLSGLSIIGMIITLIGISLVILKSDRKKIELGHPLRGVLFAILGALGQAGGVILGKMGQMDLGDNLSSIEVFAYQGLNTQIRAIAGIICFGFLVTYVKGWSRVVSGLKNRKAMAITTLGSFAGPYVGVTLLFLSLIYIQAGITSTIISIVPVVIIIPHRVLFKQKIVLRDIVGAVITVIGVSLLFL